MKTALELQRDVLDELDWEPSVEAAEVGVTVIEGVVTLVGAVSSFAEKRAAEGAVKRVAGVRAVANDLRVRLPSGAERTDTDIAQAALKALEWTVTVPRERIIVSVQEGWITLEGDVERQFQREAAASAVRDLIGVKGVTNRIEVKPAAFTREIQGRIEEALRRSAEVDARRVRVEAERGRVVLRGTVSSWTEKEAAERAAWAAPGVVRVENAVEVEAAPPGLVLA